MANDFIFLKNSEYTRSEIYHRATGKKEKPTYPFQQTGYARIDNNLFIFMNIGTPGRTGEDYKNYYDSQTETISWCAKGKTHSAQPLMQRIINGELNLYFFARWKKEDVKFKYLGLGHVISYQDDVLVADKDGNDTFCIEYQLTCKNTDEDLANEKIHDGVLVEKKTKPKSRKKHKGQRKFKARKSQDYLLKEIRNKKIGTIGERLVLSWERKRLVDLGLTELANSVEHTSELHGDGTGYDIKSFNEDGSVRYIEVKTTKLGLNTEFFMSPNEIDFAEINRENYFIYRVYDLNLNSLKGTLYRYHGDLLTDYVAEPTEYRLHPK
jgi:hypothetical protein